MTNKQKGVLQGMGLGLAITLTVGFVGLAISPDVLTPNDDLASRLRFVSGWVFVLVICLVIAIGRLARHRFFSPQDIDGSGLTAGSEQAKCYQAILQNTLEQTVLALPLYATSAVFLPTNQLALIPFLAICFASGRILFTLGYKRGAAARAVGFALTFYPTLFLLVVLLINLAKGSF